MRATHIWKNERRYHRTPIGDFPGVTTILNNTADKRFLQAWIARVGQQEADRLKQEGIDRGNFTHNLIEMYLETGEKPCLDELSPQYNKLGIEALKYCDTIEESLYIEEAMYSKLGFAGSGDLIGKRGDQIILFDWKTSSKKKQASHMKDYQLQVAAYRQLALETLDIKCDKAIIVLFYADAKGNGGTFELELKTDQLDTLYDEFLARLKSYNLRIEYEENKRNKINTIFEDF